MSEHFPRGAIPSSRHKLAAATPHVPDPKIVIPSAFLMWPKKKSTWGNLVDGDCVSAEEAAAKAMAYPQIFVPDRTLIDWASAHGYLQGATLTDVMDTMQSQGLSVSGETYDDGPYNSVDWTNSSILKSAIYSHGPVKIGVDADWLETIVGSPGQAPQDGWCAGGAPTLQREDHCVNLCGFGSLEALVDLFEANAVIPRVPKGMPTGLSYALFTWGSIGIVSAWSVRQITGEAWIRNPVTLVS